ncbi:MAG TPA: hypothetical protein P5299_01920, partial [Candidatus Woesebacteria bacterium]|nr:hypothetical protein [Candidatus Woesebacteria bacterium]
VSGTLEARKIIAEDLIVKNEGSINKLMADKVSSLREEIRQMILESGTTTPEATESALVAESHQWTLETDIASDSAKLTGNLTLTNNLIVGAKLLVSGDAQLGNAFISGTFTAGEIAIKDNFIETTNTALYIQPSGLGSVHIMGDTLIVAENGDVVVSGNLAVNGQLTAHEASVSSNLFAKIIDADEVRTKKLITENISVATDSATTIIAQSGFGELATNSAEIASNATAGTAVLPAGKTELILHNLKLTDKSMVYLTPVGSTNNQVIYLKNKSVPTITEASESAEASASATPTPSFTIAIDQALDKDVQVNWWIIN